jgi:NTP pyrophosphatase (non-canonical NTP hydrolase)
MNIGQLSVLVNQFVDERDWHQFHTPKNLAMAISVEANELLELFLWEDGKEEIDNKKWLSVRQELADIVIYCMAFANRIGARLDFDIENKIERNAEKYPIVEWIGRAK